MAYENCLLTTKNNLCEIARMAWGSGRNEQRNGGEGRMGIWEVNGQTRILKFNTGLGERLFSDSLADDERLLQSSNRLRHELVHIAESAGVDDAVMRSIRERLGLGADGENAPQKLLDRKDVASVVTMIGGDEVWNDALQQMNRAAYSSSGRNMRFKALVDRQIQPQIGAFVDDREDILNARVDLLNACLQEIRNRDDIDWGIIDAIPDVRDTVNRVLTAVFNAETVQKLAAALNNSNQADFRDRIAMCAQYAVAMCGEIDEGLDDPNLIADIRSACVREMKGGALYKVHLRLQESGLKIRDFADHGGSVIFASENATKLFFGGLDILDRNLADGKMSAALYNEHAIRMCENLSWALGLGLSCCADGRGRRETLNALAAAYGQGGHVKDDLSHAAFEAFRDDLMKNDHVRENADAGAMNLTAMMHLAESRDLLRNMRREANEIITQNNLGGLLPQNDILLSADGDLFERPEDLMNAQVDETLLSRPFFVQYRLELLKGVADALNRGEISRDNLQRVGLTDFLNGQVLGDLSEKLRFEAFSKVKVFDARMSKLKADFAAECLESAPPHWPKAETEQTMRAALGCRLRRNISSTTRISTPAEFQQFISMNRREFSELNLGLGMLPAEDVRMLSEKNVDLLTVFRYESGALKNAPDLHQLVLVARAAREGDEVTAENLIDMVKNGRRNVTFEKLMRVVDPNSNPQPLSADDAVLFDYVRVQFPPKVVEGLATTILDAFNGLRKLVDEMSRRVAGLSGDAAVAEARTRIVGGLNRPRMRALFAKQLEVLGQQGGLGKLRCAWSGAARPLSDLRREVGKMRALLQRHGLAAGCPFAAGSVDDVLRKEFGIDVISQLALGLVSPGGSEDVKKALVRIRARQTLIRDQVKAVRQAEQADRPDSKNVFVKRAVLNVLANLPCKFFDTEEKISVLEGVIREELDREGGLGQAVADVIAAKGQGVKQEFGAVRRLMFHVQRIVLTRLTKGPEMEKILGIRKDASDEERREKGIGQEETQDFISHIGRGMLAGNGMVADMIARLEGGEEWPQRITQLAGTLNTEVSILQVGGAAPQGGWSPSLVEASQILTGLPPDQLTADQRHLVIDSAGTFVDWRDRGIFTQSAGEIPVPQVATGFRPELPDISDAKDVDPVIRKLYAQGFEDEVFDVASDAVDVLTHKGKPYLIEEFGRSLNKLGPALRGNNPVGACLMFVSNLVPPTIDSLPSLGALKRGSVYGDIVTRLANVRRDCSGEMLRRQVRDIFTDVAASCLRRGMNGLERTEASDLVMAYWAMADQALEILERFRPEPRATVETEASEAESLNERLSELKRIVGGEDEAVVLGRPALASSAGVGTWNEDTCSFRVLGGKTEKDTAQVDAKTAKLILGGHDKVRDVRVDNGVFLFKPVGKDEPMDWRVFFGNDWSDLSEEMRDFFTQVSKLAEEMPGTVNDFLDAFRDLSRPLLDHVSNVDPDFAKTLQEALESLPKYYASRLKDATKDLDEIRNPKWFRSLMDDKLTQGVEYYVEEGARKSARIDLVRGVRVLLDHVLDRIAENWVEG